MERITEKKVLSIVRVTNNKSIKQYINDPYFLKVREIAAAFLKKVGLPESFKKPKNK